MTAHTRPLLLGYIRADLLRDRADLPRVEAQLEAFAHREAFSLGAVYVERGSAPAAFEALMTEVTRDETTHGVVVPDLRHVTVVEQLVLTRHEAGARTCRLHRQLHPPFRRAWRGHPRHAPGSPLHLQLLRTEVSVVTVCNQIELSLLLHHTVTRWEMRRR